jgi:NADH-quinone oxidoreductase subunit M
MNPVLWLLLAAAALPAIGAMILPVLKEQARIGAVIASFAGFAAASAAAIAHVQGHLTEVHGPLLLQVDALGATLAPALALISAAALLSLPRRSLYLRILGGTLLLQGLGTLTLLVGDIRALLAAELISAGTTLWLLRPGKTRRIGTLTLTMSFSLLLGVVVFALASTSGEHPGSFAAMVPVLTAHPIWLVLLGLAAAIRLGAFPFHAWLVTAFEEMPSAGVVPLVVPATVLLILSRLVTPALSVLAPEAPTLVVGGALLVALLAHMMAWIQHDLQRGLGFSVTGGLSLVVVALLDPDTTGRVGGVALWAAWTVATGGFALAVGAVVSRMGPINLRTYHALSERTPRLKVLFLLLGLATAAGPGTIDFVGEELVLHGSLGHHPVLLTLALAGLAVHGLNVLRWTFRIFDGPTSPFQDERTRLELLPRERWALLLLLALLVLGGLFPSALPVVAGASHG